MILLLTFEVRIAYYNYYMAGSKMIQINSNLYFCYLINRLLIDWDKNDSAVKLLKSNRVQRKRKNKREKEKEKQREEEKKEKKRKRERQEEKKERENEKEEETEQKEKI